MKRLTITLESRTKKATGWEPNLFVSHSTVTFDEEGNTIDSSLDPALSVMWFALLPNSSPRTVRLRYDAQGRISERTIVDAQNVPVIQMHYTYTPDGKLARVEKYTTYEETREQYKTVYLYNLREELIERVVYSIDGTPSTRYTYRHDEQTKMTTKEMFDGRTNILTQEAICHYDERAHTREGKVLDGHGQVLSKDKITYDDKGNESEVLAYNDHDSLISKTIIIHEYDAMDNWIKEIRNKLWPSSPNDESLAITSRIIEYFSTTNAADKKPLPNTSMKRKCWY